MMRGHWGALALAWTMLAAPAWAQDAAPATTTIPTSAFAARSPYGDEPKLSPDGKHIAYVVQKDGEAWIGIVDVDAGKVVDTLPAGKDIQVRWVQWAGNDRLLISVVMPLNVTWATGRMSRLLVDNLRERQLYFVGPRSQGLEGDDLVYVDPDGAYILLSSQISLGREPEVWRFSLDTVNDRGVKVLAKRGVWAWVADNQGVVRIGLGYENRKIKVWYRRTSDEDLQLIARLGHDDTDDDKYWNVLRLIGGSDDGLALKPGPSGHVALRRFNYATREAGEVLFENAAWDIDAFDVDVDGKPRAVYFTDDRDRVVWLDPAMAKLQDDLGRALGGQPVSILQMARDKSRFLIERSGSGDPGTWYVYTAATHQLAPFSAIRPGLDPTQLAAAKPVDYTARDGTKIRAYLTLPRGREAKGLPLIVMPHGGPYGVRDKLAYDSWVQLLANRGYAVLRPNYRGSGGFGDTFDELGKGQIGRRMQDDLDDGMDWAVAQGIADPQRVCLVGGSYGGYAALWGVIRNPERYRCAASYAGVTDWDKELAYDNAFLTRDEHRSLLERFHGDDRTFDLDTVSPIHQAAQLHRPVLIGHGRKDSRVPFSQFELMRSALTQAKFTDAQYVILPESGHGFDSAKEEQAWYDALLAFLAKNNPA